LKGRHPERSEVEGSRGSAVGFIAGFLDCARNDETVYA